MNEINTTFNLNNFIRASQYFATVPASSNFYTETIKILERFFASDLVCFIQKSELFQVIEHSQKCDIFLNDFLTQSGKFIDDVLNSGFLITEKIKFNDSGEIHFIFLPINIFNQTKSVLGIGYKNDLDVNKETLNILLAISTLLGTFLEKQSTEKSFEILLKEHKTILSTAGEGIMGIDTQYNHTFVNPTAAKILGYSIDEMIGHNSHQLWHYKHADGSPFELQSCEINLALDKGIKYSSSDEVFIRKDGSSFASEVVVTPITEDGKASGGVIVFKDITARKLIEASLKESQLKYADLYDNSPDMYASVDANSAIVTQCNQTLADKLGYEKDEIIGEQIFNLYHSECMSDVKDSFEKFLSSGEVRNKELQLKSKRGSKIPVLLNVTSVRDAEDKILYSRSVWVDISALKQAEDALKKANDELQEERNRFALAIEGAQDGLWDWNLQTDDVVLSERFETMLGYEPGSLPKNIDAWFSLLHPDDKEQASSVVQKYLSGGNENYENTFRLRAKDGSWRWILGRGKAQFNTDGTPKRFVGFNTDITDQKEYQNKLDYITKHDQLTNLPNRFLLSELLTLAMLSVKRNKEHLALLLIDIDGFKEINDKYGREAGNEVLSIMARRMDAIVRDNDIVSRLGGDEFVLVVTELKQSNEVIPMLNRLLNELSSNIVLHGKDMHISVSIGVSVYPQKDDIGNEVLLRQADQAMYFAKLSGKNQYQFFDLGASLEHKEQQQHIANLREAIKKNQFVLYYQPKADIKNNKIIGLEALLRWNHPKKGLMYPDSFLPLAEHDSSFMIELGHWVFEHAFSQLEAWHLDNLDITLSINVSAYEVQQQNFAPYLKSLFDKHPSIKPNTIEIELLETAAFDNFELTSKTLRDCQELGVSIAIDDFGTGYASLNYLKELPMNTLKIDKSFVMDLLNSSKNLSIVEASIGLAHAFSCHVVAEGVESEEHGKVLLQLGCEVAQGYAIAKAMPARDVLDWTRSWKGFPSWRGAKPINENNRAILYASVEHRTWINSIERYIQDKSSKFPELGSSHCHLGNWLLHGASYEQRKHPEFKLLNKLHSQLHDYAKKLLHSGKKDKSAGIQMLRQLREEILQKLEALTVQE